MGKENQEHGTSISGDIKDDLIKRLRRIEGQVRGLQRMIEEGRACEEIIYQVSAVKAAVNQVAMTILSNQLAVCVCKEISQGASPEEAMEKFQQTFKRFYN